MIRIPYGKIYNSYIIETYNYAAIKAIIKEFAVYNGFDRALVEAESHPDIFYLEHPDTNIPISEVREKIIDTSVFAPKIAEKKIYVIYDAINLKDIVQNAMLKTLEEPPEFDIFFLVTSNSNSFLDTVKSRCLIIKDNEEDNYKDLLELEYIDDAITMLTNAKYSSVSDKMKFAEIFLDKENNLKDLIKLYRYVLRDAMLYSTTLSKDKLNLREKENSIISMANTFTMQEMGKMIDNLNKLSDENRYNVNKKMAVFNFLEV